MLSPLVLTASNQAKTEHKKVRWSSRAAERNASKRAPRVLFEARQTCLETDTLLFQHTTGQQCFHKICGAT